MSKAIKPVKAWGVANDANVYWGALHHSKENAQILCDRQRRFGDLNARVVRVEIRVIYPKKKEK